MGSLDRRSILPESADPPQGLAGIEKTSPVFSTTNIRHSDKEAPMEVPGRRTIEPEVGEQGDVYGLGQSVFAHEGFGEVESLLLNK